MSCCTDLILNGEKGLFSFGSHMLEFCKCGFWHSAVRGGVQILSSEKYNRVDLVGI